jgi:hypothetical protein
MEDPIFETFQLGRLDILNVVRDIEKAQQAPFLFFGSRKNILKANILNEWKISIAIKNEELPADGYAKTFTTVIVAPATYMQNDVEAFFTGDWTCIIGGQPYYYLPASIKRVKGKAI